MLFLKIFFLLSLLLLCQCLETFDSSGNPTCMVFDMRREVSMGFFIIAFAHRSVTSFGFLSKGPSMNAIGLMNVEIAEQTVE